MSRMTRARAAAQVANDLHVDNDVLLEVPDDAPRPVDTQIFVLDSNRPPLGEILHNIQNGAPSDVSEACAEFLEQSKKSHKDRKKAKTAAKLSAFSSNERAETPSTSEPPSAIRHESECVTSEANATSHSKPLLLTTIYDESAHSNEHNSNDTSNQISQHSPIQTHSDLTSRTNAGYHIAADMAALSLHAPASPLPNALPTVIHNLRKSNVRSCSNKENVEPPVSPVLSESRTPLSRSTYDALEAAVINAATPPPAATAVPRLRRASSVASGEVTLLTLETALESTSVVPSEAGDDQCPDLSPTSISTPPSENITEPSSAVGSDKPKSKKPALVVRPTKTSQARMSIAQGGNYVPRPSLGPPLDAARKASLRTVSGGSDTPETVIPHSKPRPMSMSFPAPPPLLRSSKAPTRSTFQLPGEAVSAKQRAAREERLRNEAEEINARRNFKARPAPNMNRPAPSVRPTNASRVREDSISVKQADAALTELGRIRAASGTTAKSRTASGTSQSSRPSSSFAASISRPSTAVEDAPNARPTSKDQPMSKNEAIFARPSRVFQSFEAQKRAKEAAVKNARAEAAERSRQLSRDWAEKQRMKRLQQTAESVQVN